MKKMIYLLCVLFSLSTFAQDTTATQKRADQRSNQNTQKERPTYYEVVDTTSYTLDKKEYIFTPTETGINVSRVDEMEGQIDFGNLHRTTEDGFYIMTTTATDDVSFGRFDQQGNLKVFRYNRDTDTVEEENFMIQDPVERRDRNRKNDNRINENKNNRSND